VGSLPTILEKERGVQAPFLTATRVGLSGRVDLWETKRGSKGFWGKKGNNAGQG